MTAPAVLDAVAHLRLFRDAGILEASDVLVAATLARLCELGPADGDVVLAVALAARAPRTGDVCIDLSRVAADLPTGELADGSPVVLPWPDTVAWLSAVASSPVLNGAHPALVLVGSRLYAQRYHQLERSVAEHLTARARGHVDAFAPVDEILDLLLTGEGSDLQRAAVRVALQRSLAVLVGGPGTGKTTTVAALLASLLAGRPDQRVALAAPTGKAAARVGEALRSAAARLPDALRSRLSEVEAVTIHRLLGVRRSLDGGFAHDRHRPLPHDIVVVDETSMVSLPLMAHLLDALHPDTRLVLVGDPDQLASVEAGAVLADLVGPVLDPGPAHTGAGGSLAASVCVLRHSRRFPPASQLGVLSGAVRAGDVTGALAVLSAASRPDDGSGDGHRDEASGGALRWLSVAADHADAVARVRDLVLPSALQACRLGAQGDDAGSLAAVESLRLLCAHRHGPFGVDRWNAKVESWLAAAGVRAVGWYPGRPVLVTANDYRNNLFNGDLGVVVRRLDALSVVFAAADGVRHIAPSRLDAVETVHATTVHKSQGSEFDHVVVVLPPADSPLATRELLYTAITRARRQVTVIGDETSVVAAIERRTVRASGLGDALWPG